MKMMIEKRLETLDDLRAAKAMLKRRAKEQEMALVGNTQVFYSELNLPRVYHEALDSFGMSSLVTLSIPYLLHYRNEILSSPIVRTVTEMPRNRLLGIAGGLTAASLLAYYLLGRK